ncbi:hypothetical protein PR048_020275 [Dryococelus australis]|uniref:Uncharacterized protein n=1 Tax=Dryococelus australis TaxID=614101 RepID=A0ABQ9H5V7_9NEOP|nr:hypothetical protein PR048_020275 [Dryococelus australis]
MFIVKAEASEHMAAPEFGFQSPAGFTEWWVQQFGARIKQRIETCLHLYIANGWLNTENAGWRWQGRSVKEEKRVGRVTLDFRRWESYRTMPLIGGFSRGSLVCPALSFRCCSILASITHIGSQELDNCCFRLASPLLPVSTVYFPQSFSSAPLVLSPYQPRGEWRGRVCVFYRRQPSGSKTSLKWADAAPDGPAPPRDETSAAAGTLRAGMFVWCFLVSRRFIPISCDDNDIYKMIFNYRYKRRPTVKRASRQGESCSIPGGVASREGSLPDFRMWESCRTMPLVGGFFLGVLPFLPVLSFRRCSSFIGSQDLDVKNRPDHFTHAQLPLWTRERERERERGRRVPRAGRRLVSVGTPLPSHPSRLGAVLMTTRRPVSRETRSTAPAARMAISSLPGDLPYLFEHTQQRAAWDTAPELTATSCGYNSSHPVWHALYECLQYIHGDSSPFLLQPFHEVSNGFWPRLTSPHPAIQFVPNMFYRVVVGALHGPVHSANIVVGVPLHSSP